MGWQPPREQLSRVLHEVSAATAPRCNNLAGRATGKLPTFGIAAPVTPTSAQSPARKRRVGALGALHAIGRTWLRRQRCRLLLHISVIVTWGSCPLGDDRSIDVGAVGCGVKATSRPKRPAILSCDVLAWRRAARCISGHAKTTPMGTWPNFIEPWSSHESSSANLGAHWLAVLTGGLAFLWLR